MLSAAALALLVQAVTVPTIGDAPADEALPRLELRRGDDYVRLRGRLMADAALFLADDLERKSGLDLDSGTELRRARLGLEGAQGTPAGPLAFRLEAEFATDEIELRDAWLSFGGLKLGHFREPLGLEAHTASPQLTLLERSTATSAFTPGRNLGAMWSGRLGAGWNVATGVFLEADDRGDAQGDDGALSARVHGLVQRDEARRSLVHLGASASLRRTREAGVSLAARPEAHLAPALVDTNTVAADHALVGGLEAAWVAGPRSVQSELFAARLDTPGADALLAGGYVQASIFLTGESRPWRARRGAFAPVAPERPFPGGPGAWELALRLSHVDLDDEGVRGGRLTTAALGATWYASRRFRVMANWVHAAASAPEESAELLLLRLQLVF